MRILVSNRKELWKNIETAGGILEKFIYKQQTN